MSRDGGSATVWLAALTALIGLVATAGVAQGGAVLARHRAESAADLAALAAAARVTDGAGRACAVAEGIAVRNGGSLAKCVLSGDDVDVEVTRPLVLGRLGHWMVTARSRAGPVERFRART